MNTQSKIWLAALVASAPLACAQSAQNVQGAPVPATAAAAPPPSARPLARDGSLTPLVVKMVEKKRSPTHAIVTARVERRSAINAPITVSIELPAGASLVRGEPKVELPASNDSSTVEAEFELTYAAVPLADFKVVAEYRTATSGARAVGTYRFGRPESTAAPLPKGTDTKMGNWNLGPSVKMQ